MRFVAWVFFLLMILFYGAGCTRVFPGNAPVSLVGDGEWTHNADDVAALDEAAALWNSLGARFSLDARGGPTLVVRIEPIPWWVQTGVADAIGAYEEVDGVVYADSRKVSAPNGLLMQVLAHELGHAIGLDHDAYGIMSARVSTDYRLSPEDIAEYRAKWGTP